ncbi:diacylglycerol kinase family protein [Prochlorococcus marinus]|uniref:Diacylglycerol kinase n=1 Tax=Prochlorococcus marinus XMU1408 TaxID=2213228 RepID=A0A318R4B7_PROMR|nr:diacylglycerol kinase family protein [Prochlorococcus marinus]MBW3041245.1 diacylglycerol kinase [Prochlorococcus marinus str. XMU1408]PYE03834.1 diacylglycerol kinase [Prochlorococcus marinus XMU1408]
MAPEISNDSERAVWDMSNTLKRSNKRSSWKIAKDLPTSFLYAAKGLRYAFSTQRNFRIHVAFALGALVLGFLLGLDNNNLAIMALTATSVLVVELLNTAIESVVDLAIGKRFHPLAQIAKDCSAGAVLVASISSVLIAVLLLFPLLLQKLEF